MITETLSLKTRGFIFLHYLFGYKQKTIIFVPNEIIEYKDIIEEAKELL